METEGWWFWRNKWSLTRKTIAAWVCQEPHLLISKITTGMNSELYKQSIVCYRCFKPSCSLAFKTVRSAYTICQLSILPLAFLKFSGSSFVLSCVGIFVFIELNVSLLRRATEGNNNWQIETKVCHGFFVVFYKFQLIRVSNLQFIENLCFVSDLSFDRVFVFEVRCCFLRDSINGMNN